MLDRLLHDERLQELSPTEAKEEEDDDDDDDGFRNSVGSTHSYYCISMTTRIPVEQRHGEDLYWSTNSHLKSAFVIFV